MKLKFQADWAGSHTTWILPYPSKHSYWEGLCTVGVATHHQVPQWAIADANRKIYNLNKWFDDIQNINLNNWDFTVN